MELMERGSVVSTDNYMSRISYWQKYKFINEYQSIRKLPVSVTQIKVIAAASALFLAIILVLTEKYLIQKLSVLSQDLKLLKLNYEFVHPNNNLILTIIMKNSYYMNQYLTIYDNEYIYSYLDKISQFTEESTELYMKWLSNTDFHLISHFFNQKNTYYQNNWLGQYQ